MVRVRVRGGEGGGDVMERNGVMESSGVMESGGGVMESGGGVWGAAA